MVKVSFFVDPRKIQAVWEDHACCCRAPIHSALRLILGPYKKWSMAGSDCRALVLRTGCWRRDLATDLLDLFPSYTLQCSAARCIHIEPHHRETWKLKRNHVGDYRYCQPEIMDSDIETCFLEGQGFSIRFPLIPTP